MTTGTVHAVARGLNLIEGHRSRSWSDDPDLPTVATYRVGARVYLLDTGAGPEQRDSIRETVIRERGVREVILLNSHGLPGYCANNDVVAELPATTTRHHVPRAARATLDTGAYVRRTFERGLGFFDYLSGLNLDAERMVPLLRALDAPPGLVERASVAALGTTPADLDPDRTIGPFVPGLATEMVTGRLPPLHLSTETMVDYEDLGSARDVVLDGTPWTGWTFLDERGRPEVHALQSGGRSAGGLVFHLPEHRFLLMAGETVSVPDGIDTVPQRSIRTVSKTLAMLTRGGLLGLCAGEDPLLPLHGDDAEDVLFAATDSAAAFARSVAEVIARHPGGLSIDALYDELVGGDTPNAIVAAQLGRQFPAHASFFKLTLLNHCLLEQFPVGLDDEGRSTFRTR